MMQVPVRMVQVSVCYGACATNMSVEYEYEYDVAFSFLRQDEQLAIEMADRIRDRVKVFIYSVVLR